MSSSSGGEPPPQINSDITLQAENQFHFDLSNRYRINDRGPYYVHIEHREKNIGRLFPIRIGHFLRNIDTFKNNIEDIKAIGLNKVKIIFRNYEIANSLVEHDIIKQNNLIAYIPTFFTQKKGVIKMVDTYFSEDYIKENIESIIKVISVKRLKRKTINDITKEITFVDRQMVFVTFLGNTIPKTVKINMVNFVVDPYIYPVVQCFNCLRYGHTNKQCKGKRKCQNCSQQNCSSENCENEKICVHCNSPDHTSISRECPMYQKQKNIKSIMAVENTSFKEAEAIANNPSYAKITTKNRFSLLTTEENFPSLPDTSTSSRSQNILTNPNKKTTIIKKNKLQKTTVLPLPKKRKSSSPLQSPSIEIYQSRPSYPSQPITPNPYREEYLKYKNIKEYIIENIIQCVHSLLVNEPTFKGVTNQLDNNIRDKISTILESNSDMDFSDNESAKSSY